jgi:transcriptional regulator with XRE-family HTH domain
MSNYFGKNLRLIRDAWNFRQLDMSEILGIEKQATYSRIENGLLDGTVPQVLVLSALTGIAVHRLWNDSITILDIPTQPLGRNNSDPPPEQPPEILKLAKQVAEILKVEFRFERKTDNALSAFQVIENQSVMRTV